MKFELTNKQREYLGLESIPATWHRVALKGDAYRPESTVYFDGETLKRHIVSTEYEYRETQYNELTKGRNILLPMTNKGKEKKLTASVLETRQAVGVYFQADNFGNLFIGNHTTQTTFFSSYWSRSNREEPTQIEIEQAIEAFISESPAGHLEEIREFRNAKRRNIAYKAGDVFAYRISRTKYGFGQILLDINQLRKKKLVPANHGLCYIMGAPLLVSIYAFTSPTKNIDINIIVDKPRLPSDLMMDNHLFYGEYEILGHCELKEGDFDFPISYGQRLDRIPNVFLQWGLIHLEKPVKDFSRYLKAENPRLEPGNPSRQINNPYGYYGIGFSHRYDADDIKVAIENGGRFDYDRSLYYGCQFDLRNPANDGVRAGILKSFGLDANGSYEENRALTKTARTTEILDRLKK